MAAGGPTRETRLSVVMAGGSSLAIYINGVCQELLHVVRGTAPSLRWDDLTPLEQTYRELLGGSPTEAPGRRVVVDILSGTSAGGINAAFLAKALEQDASIEDLKDLWVRHGDFAGLFNDREGLARHRDDRVDGDAKLDRPEDFVERPKSLLSGDVFYVRMFEALDKLSRKGRGPGAPLADAIDCYLTTTDLRGTPVEVPLANRGAANTETTARELQWRSRFRFRHGTEAATGRDDLDQLGPQSDVLLAFAARATSAHPAAFPPTAWRTVKALHHDLRGRRVGDVDLEAVLGPLPARPDEGPRPDRWYSDGGDIDNKPLSYALEPLRDRRAEVPVDRRLVFVEPDPSRPHEGDWNAAGLPALSQYTAGAYGLGRKETIRQDIEDIRARNDAVQRLTTATNNLFRRTDDQVWAAFRERSSRDGVAILGEDRQAAVTTVLVEQAAAVGDRWRAASAQEVIEAGSSNTYAFELYRYQSVVQDLARVAVGARDPDTGDVQAWAAALRARIVPDPGAEGPMPHRVFLADHDIGYRLRRLTFLEHLLSRWQVSPARADDFSAARAQRRALNRLYLRLRAIKEHLDAGEAVARRPPGTDPASGAGPFLDEARAVLEQPMKEASDEARHAISTLTATHPALGTALAEAWVNYDLYDQLVLPVWDVAQGEIQQIFVYRVSPLDTPSLVDEAGGRQKLGGVALGHFGAFLDEAWRRSDILWGRLDGAEVLLSGVLRDEFDGAGPDLAAALERIQVAILADHLPRAPEEGRADLEALLSLDVNRDEERHAEAVAAVRGYEAGSDESERHAVAATVRALLAESWTVDRSATGDRGVAKAQVLVRGSRVAGRMLRFADHDPWALTPQPARGNRGLAIAGRALANLVQGALGSSVEAALVRYVLLPVLALAGAAAYAGGWWVGGTVWPAVAFLAAVVLLLGDIGLQLTGWLRRAVLAVCLALLVLTAWMDWRVVVLSSWGAVLAGVCLSALLWLLPRLGSALRNAGQERATP